VFACVKENQAANYTREVRAQWSTQISTNPYISMLWAAATMCFFESFHSGEITIPSIAAYDATVGVMLQLTILHLQAATSKTEADKN